MNRSLSVAIIMIAIYSIPTGAIGQNAIYRCGNNYSQKPCTDAVVVEVQDTRTAQQKAQADATIRRDTATGNAMERDRLSQETRQRAAQAKLTAAEKKQSASTAKNATIAGDTEDTVPAKDKRKKMADAQKKPAPEIFTASTPKVKSKPNTGSGKPTEKVQP